MFCYFTGIKGTGMSHLACLLAQCGNRVEGEDVSEDFFTSALLDGIRINPLSTGCPDDADVLIYSSSHERLSTVENARKQSSLESELQALQSKIDSLTANLDRMYTDRLSGLLPEADFQRIFGRIKLERERLEEKRQELELRPKSPVRSEDGARELVQRFIETTGESRELLVSLIERVELTEDKEIIIKFRFAQLDETAESQTPQGIAPSHTA